ncbi:MAG: 50S ribosomal protein L6 [Thermoproteota archaeon]|nr:50S ribosomal protein L6 [Candidatus Brockarchaeota archaeon]MBO3762663.1 50S ribosomal protein L6 [Candidatus Brockarchaeota archaeon]MBO3768723.1 50S ribosomal protein L6 [Candidatus Brockarchaeota archaeon]MBO3801049.1 50S ribosomal protein L6 [Candidatus Brockarchaeota archaeon]
MYTKEKQIKSVTLKIPENVSLKVEGSSVIVKGKLGELKKDFSKSRVWFELKNNELTIFTDQKGRRGKALIGTIRKKILNAITGVNKKYIVRLKVAHSHFPITVKVDKGFIRIENFMGEKSPRLVRIPNGVEVQAKEQDIILSGLDIDSVTLLGGMLENATKVKDKDQRVFLDGIYIQSKGYE